MSQIILREYTGVIPAGCRSAVGSGFTSVASLENVNLNVMPDSGNTFQIYNLQQSASEELKTHGSVRANSLVDAANSNKVTRCNPRNAAIATTVCKDANQKNGVADEVTRQLWKLWQLWLLWQLWQLWLLRSEMSPPVMVRRFKIQRGARFNRQLRSPPKRVEDSRQCGRDQDTCVTISENSRRSCEAARRCFKLATRIAGSISEHLPYQKPRLSPRALQSAVQTHLCIL